MNRYVTVSETCPNCNWEYELDAEVNSWSEDFGEEAEIDDETWNKKLGICEDCVCQCGDAAIVDPDVGLCSTCWAESDEISAHFSKSQRGEK